MTDSPHPSRYVPMPSIRTLAAGLAASLAIVALAVTAPEALGQGDAAQQQKKTAPAEKKVAPAPTVQGGDRIKAPKGFKVELVYSVPRETQGSLGQPGGRPQGPADHLRPVRQALPGHPARHRGVPLGDQGRADPGRARRGPGPALGIRQPLRRGQLDERGQVRPLSGPRQPTATTSSTRSSSSRSSKATANTARTP